MRARARDGRRRTVVPRACFALLAVSTMALVGTACGGGGPEPTISKEQYLREGNAICANGNARIAAVARQPVAGGDPDVLATFVRAFVPGIRDQLRQLRQLGYPKDDRMALEDIFADAEDVLRRAEEDPTTIDGHAFDDVNRRLSTYGLRVCGS